MTKNKILSAPKSSTLSDKVISKITVIKLLLVPLMVIIFGFGVTLLVLLFLPEIQSYTVEILAWVSFALSVLILILFKLVAHRNSVRMEDVGFRKPTARFWHLLWQIPVMILVALIVQAIFASTFGIERSQGRSIEYLVRNTSVAVAIVASLTVSVLVPLWEEITFRGILFNGIKRRVGTALAIILSALLFSIAHIAPALMPYMFMVGLGLGFIRVFHDNLWASIIAHISLNTLVTGLLLVAVL